MGDSSKCTGKIKETNMEIGLFFLGILDLRLSSRHPENPGMPAFWTVVLVFLLVVSFPGSVAVISIRESSSTPPSQTLGIFFI